MNCLLSEVETGTGLDAAVNSAIASKDWNAAAESVARGNRLTEQGLLVEAAENFRSALRLSPSLRIARRSLAIVLARMGQREESFEVFHEEVLTCSDGLKWVQDLVTTAMRARDLSLAGEYAAILVALRRASVWHPRFRIRSDRPLPVQPFPGFLTIPKLVHDIEQFEYLQRLGVLVKELMPVIASYRRVIDRLISNGITEGVPLSPEDRQSIGNIYNRVLHVRHTPRVQRALSDTWDTTGAERRYLQTRPGLIVIDNFLTAEALEGVRRFCLESTVWFANRYRHGRLGAFFHEGFNCPLLLQIAEELREALPGVIGDRYSLRQLWGFKNAPLLPADSTNHADFAAVNVNFWVTPDDANLDDNSGGLVVYDVDAPLSWDFNTYNGRPDIIKPFLRQQGARATNIPYRQNRAIIFNSDLFHATAEVRFRPGYENRRINVTMLYGDRENDVHHVGLARQNTSARPQAWRSASFSRVRMFRSH